MCAQQKAALAVCCCGDGLKPASMNLSLGQGVREVHACEMNEALCAIAKEAPCSVFLC